MRPESITGSSHHVDHKHSTPEPPRRRRFVIDDLIRTCSQTVFNPAVAVLVPAAVAAYTNRDWISWDALGRVPWRRALGQEGYLAIKTSVRDSKALSWSLWYMGTVLAACEQNFRGSAWYWLCIDVRTSALYSSLSYAYDQRVKPFHRPGPLRWDEQIIVITGGEPYFAVASERGLTLCGYFELGSNGIGFRIAVKAATRGAKVVILDVGEPNRGFLRKSYGER